MVLLNSDICDFNKEIVDFRLKNINGKIYSSNNLLGDKGTFNNVYM